MHSRSDGAGIDAERGEWLITMAMNSKVMIWVAEKVWMSLSGWLSACFLLAEEIARSLDDHEELPHVH